MNDLLSQRMKQYENVSRNFLIKKLPVVIRIDGKAFHSYTRGLKKPFDESLIACMNLATEETCKQIQGFKLAYVQSDEISIILSDLNEIKTEAWFENNINKIVSVSASLFTGYFNNYESLNGKIAFFDSRAFNLPLHEVENYIIWRYKDCIRNSILSVGQSVFSHKELLNKNQLQIKEMLKNKNIDWDNDFSSWEKHGRLFWKVNGEYHWEDETPDFFKEETKLKIRNMVLGNYLGNKEDNNNERDSI